MHRVPKFIVICLYKETEIGPNTILSVVHQNHDDQNKDEIEEDISPFVRNFLFEQTL